MPWAFYAISNEEVSVKELKERRTMEPEDLFRLQFLQGTQLSPDGKWVAYAVLSTDREKDEELQHEHDWRCPAEQSEQFYAVLKASGCIVEMVRFPAGPHGGHADGPPVVRRVQNEAILDWMNRYVLGEEQVN